jgi:hypothetical protein
MDKAERLWLTWYPVLANQWETSIPMYRLSSDYSGPGAPNWSWQDVLFVKVGDLTERGIQPTDNFVSQVREQLEQYGAYFKDELLPGTPDSIRASLLNSWQHYKRKIDSLSCGRNMIRAGRVVENGEETNAPLGYPLTRRLGWQTKNKAVFVGDRMVVPLYSDGFDCSLFALSDDNGESWQFSNPVLGGAGIQPTIAEAKNGTLVAYLRDNGPRPYRMQRTESKDRGLTWSIATDDLLPNPGAGFDMVTMPSGEWVIVYNDAVEGRHNLTAALSDDDGKSWRWKRNIENELRKEGSTRSHYPAVVAGKDGRLHITYSYHRDDIKPGRTIKYVTIDLAWIKEGATRNSIAE